MILELVDRFRTEVTDPLKRRFVGRDEVVDLIALAVVSGEHLFLYGPPGTAKSALIRGFAESIRAKSFEYLLTRFSEPNELFGPIDLAKLRDGTVATVTTGMLPEAELAFLDELFNANSAILNNLLTVLNERVYRRGAEVHRLPLLSLFTASNHLAEDEALRALFDRFLLRCRVENLKREAMTQLLSTGWALERATATNSSLSAADLRFIGKKIFEVDLSGILGSFAEVVWKVRDLGVALSDRRSVKILKLVAASALLSGRFHAVESDYWVFRYVWDREEQIDPLSGLVAGILEQQENDDSARHPLAKAPDQVDPEELAAQFETIRRQLAGFDNNRPGLVEVTRLREQLTELADRAAWIADEQSRSHLIETSAQLLKQLG